MARSTPAPVRLLLVVAVLALAGCAGGPGAGSTAPAIPDVSGNWVGGVTVEGQAIEGTLTLVQEGPSLQARFTAPGFGIDAEGTGTINAAGELDIRLDYNMQCPGTARLDGARSADGALLSGVVQAGDCTGQMVGAFDFRRAASSR